MTDIERKALALLQDCGFHGGYIDRKWNENYEALCRAIEQHEAYRQEVSDAVELAIDRCGHDGLRAGHINEYLGSFTLPKPDPLVEALNEAGDASPLSDDAFADALADAFAKELRAALAARGLKIVEVE